MKMSDEKKEPPIVSAWREAAQQAKRDYRQVGTMTVGHGPTPDRYRWAANGLEGTHALTDDERFEQWWNSDPRRVDQNHLKLSARIGWNGALQQVSSERESARRFAAEHDDCVTRAAYEHRSRVADADTKELRSRAERAEKRCADLSGSSGAELASAQRHYLERIVEMEHTVASLRANLADANAREANHAAEVSRLQHALTGARRHVETLLTEIGGLRTPSREKAIAQLDAKNEALRRLRATGQSIIDIARNGLKDA
jgi:hypothetical protein